jgi:hypothetical protein
MSVEVRPLEQFRFRGIVTAGNPLARPKDSAEVCTNFRVMPGDWLRLRSGRKYRGLVMNNGIVQQFRPFVGVGATGLDQQLAQVKIGSSPSWHWFSLMIYSLVPGPAINQTEIEPIATAYDDGFALKNAAAATSLMDRPVVYNGLGVRDGVNSRPPLTAYYNSQAFYYGLDAYCPSGNPTASFASGGGFNELFTHARIYVGLYNSSSEHYGNGVYAGTIESTNGAGTISVSGLSALKYATHGAGETSSLWYVFYATIDGGDVPYLILNSTLDGPHKVPVTQASASLSIATGTDNGWVIDLAKEMPIDNFPPRPMRTLAYVNGRLYAAPMFGGSGFDSDFSYMPRYRDYASVVWSAAASDARDTEFLGDPLQSWPLFNQAYTPSGDTPIALAPAAEAASVLVITSTATFYLTEAADGIHEYTTISLIHGIRNPTTLRATQYGMVWVDQRNQFVLLKPGAREVTVLSDLYQSVIGFALPTCADYVVDPVNQVDRYQVWLDSGISVSHDFGIGGQCYTANNQDYTAAATVMESSGRKHHIVAKTQIYTHEGQPEDGLVFAVDQRWDGAQIVSDPYQGFYRLNWTDFGDPDQRKELPHLEITGDCRAVASLGSVPPIYVFWFSNLDIDAQKLTSFVRSPQTVEKMNTYRYKLAEPNHFWFKFAFLLNPHPADLVNNCFPPIGQEGSLASNFYGSIVRAAYRVGVSENRA